MTDRRCLGVHKAGMIFLVPGMELNDQLAGAELSGHKSRDDCGPEVRRSRAIGCTSGCWPAHRERRSGAGSGRSIWAVSNSSSGQSKVPKLIAPTLPPKRRRKGWAAAAPGILRGLGRKAPHLPKSSKCRPRDMRATSRKSPPISRLIRGLRAPGGPPATRSCVGNSRRSTITRCGYKRPVHLFRIRYPLG